MSFQDEAFDNKEFDEPEIKVEVGEEFLSVTTKYDYLYINFFL